MLLVVSKNSALASPVTAISISPSSAKRHSTNVPLAAWKSVFDFALLSTPPVNVFDSKNALPAPSFHNFTFPPFPTVTNLTFPSSSRSSPELPYNALFLGNTLAASTASPTFVVDSTFPSKLKTRTTPSLPALKIFFPHVEIPIAVTALTCASFCIGASALFPRKSQNPTSPQSEPEYSFKTPLVS